MQKKLISISIIGFLCLCALGSSAQENFGNSKVWYSTFLSKKLSPHWYFNNYLVFAFKASGQLSFAQNDISLRYRFNKVWSMGATYKHAQYRVFPGMTKVYPQQITAIGSIIFQGGAIDLRYDHKLGKSFRFSQSIIVQAYFPRFEKYQFRYISRTKLSYRNKKAWLKLTPYVKFMLYYYQNGKPQNYYDNAGEIDLYRSPNGFHRYRAIVGFSFRPIKKMKQLGLNFYYAINREFNFGNARTPLNAHVPSSGTFGERIKVPFNNYEIFGAQLNLLFGKK